MKRRRQRGEGLEEKTSLQREGLGRQKQLAQQLSDGLHVERERAEILVRRQTKGEVTSWLTKSHPEHVS